MYAQATALLVVPLRRLLWPFQSLLLRWWMIVIAPGPWSLRKLKSRGLGGSPGVLALQLGTSEPLRHDANDLQMTFREPGAFPRSCRDESYGSKGAGRRVESRKERRDKKSQVRRSSIEKLPHPVYSKLRTEHSLEVYELCLSAAN